MRWIVALLLFVLPETQEKLRIASEEFVRRRETLTERLSDGAIALDAGPILQVDRGGNPGMFDFKYLAGLHDDEGILVIIGKKTTVFVTQPEKGDADGQTILETSKFADWAAANLAQQTKFYTKLRQKNLNILKQAAPEATLVGARLGSEIARLRLVKSEAEIKLMRKAADATNKALRAAMRALKPAMKEKEIQDLVESTFKKEGCPDLGFPSICASGRNGTILHYFDNSKTIPADTLMVCDIGAAVENYVTDITRTLPTSGKFSAEQRRHYQCVLDAQKAAEAILKPGATFLELERAARKVFTDRGLLKWSYAFSEDLTVRHGLGHYVGMYVHDSGAVGQKFEPGVVITIEPGWYDKDAGYGIRIEDTYLVTRDGFERLSADAPREIDEIEKFMKGKKEY